jgi:hypothetical protein
MHERPDQMENSGWVGDFWIEIGHLGGYESAPLPFQRRNL